MFVAFLNTIFSQLTEDIWQRIQCACLLSLWKLWKVQRNHSLSLSENVLKFTSLLNFSLYKSWHCKNKNMSKPREKEKKRKKKERKKIEYQPRNDFEILKWKLTLKKTHSLIVMLVFLQLKQFLPLIFVRSFVRSHRREGKTEHGDCFNYSYWVKHTVAQCIQYTCV